MSRRRRSAQRIARGAYELTGEILDEFGIFDGEGRPRRPREARLVDVPVASQRRWRDRIWPFRKPDPTWRDYEKAYLLLAGLSTPLVLSVHSIVSFDFAVSQLPGWHTTIFPPYFVAGAVFSGFGMVLTLMIPLRSLYRGMDEIVTTRHLEFMCKVTLTTGSIVGYAYGMEFFIAYYGGNPYELYAFKNRAFGDYYWSYWLMVSCNVISPHLFWFKWCRTTPWFIWGVSILVNIGMWMERFVIVVTSLHNDYMPGNWGYYTPTWVDVMTYIGTLGFFMTLFLLFCRFLPLVAISEVKGVTPFADPHHPMGGAKK